MILEMMKEFQLDIIWNNKMDCILSVLWRGIDLYDYLTKEELERMTKYCRENYPDDTRPT